MTPENSKVDTDNRRSPSRGRWLWCLVGSLRERPQDWIIGEHTARHTSGLEIWIANMPILDIAIYKPCERSVPLVWKWRIWRAVSAAKEYQFEQLLSPNEKDQPRERASVPVGDSPKKD